jgi:hypothetical protein
MCAKSKIAAAVAIGAIFLVAKEASAQLRANSHTNVRHLPRSLERTYEHFPSQVPRFGDRRDVYSSDSLGHQSFRNPDRDFSIQNLSSHQSGQ